MPTLVSAVGGGDLGTDIDLPRLAHESEFPFKSYEPETVPFLQLKIHEDSPKIMLYSTGKYNIAGADSVESLKQARDELVEYISTWLGKDELSTEFEVRFLTFLDQYDRELNLESIASDLGHGEVEYNAETYTGLIFRPESSASVFTIFRTGRVLLTGVGSTDEAHDLFEALYGQLDTLFENHT